MNTSRLFISLFFPLLFLACSKLEKSPAEVRFGQFLVTEKPLHFKLVSESEKRIYFDQNLPYKKLTAYDTFPSGKYSLEISVEGKNILKKKFGLGNGAIYTIVTHGLLPDKAETSQLTFSTKLHRITEGAEARTPNGFLPQCTLLDDKFETATDEAKLRYIHLAPGVSGLQGKWVTSSEQIDLPSLKYPKISRTKAITANQGTLQLYLKGGKIGVTSAAIPIKKEHLYTIFVLGKTSGYINSLATVTGITEKQHTK